MRLLFCSASEMVRVLIRYIVRLAGRETGTKLDLNICSVKSFVSSGFGPDEYM